MLQARLQGLIAFMNLFFCRDVLHARLLVLNVFDLYGRLQGLIVFMNLFFCRDDLYGRLQVLNVFDLYGRLNGFKHISTINMS